MSADRYFDGSRIRTRYRLEGEGPNMVLVHGVSDQLEGWDHVVPYLEKNFRILRFDLRGHGSSDKPDGPYSLEDFAGDLAELTVGLGFERFHLAGFSLGGLVAQRFTLDYPDRVDHLILLSTVAGRNEVERTRVTERLEAVEKGDFNTHFESSIRRWYTDDFIARNPHLLASAGRGSSLDQASIRAAYRVLCTSDLIDELPCVKSPTLIITGEHDIGSNPRMAGNMHNAIAGSSMEILPGMKHSILIEVPGTVSKLVQDFIAGQR